MKKQTLREVKEILDILPDEKLEEYAAYIGEERGGFLNLIITEEDLYQIEDYVIPESELLEEDERNLRYSKGAALFWTE